MGLEKGKIVEFDMKKQLKYVEQLGKGGTGKALLFKDEITDVFFAVKKYETEDESHREEYFNRFVNEIKILYRITHPNIVKVYNCYLYPESQVGYLQMEYIKGSKISEYSPSPWDKDWDVIFKETISAFEYLEKNNILHRDIRPENILIDEEQNVKIIDFGFGKILKTEDENEKNSIVLNWPVTQFPEDIVLYHKYDHTTEIYFVGKLFKHLLEKDDRIENFKYNSILTKMIQVEREKRYQSFSEIVSDISGFIFDEDYFNDEEKQIYQTFSNELHSHIIKFNRNIERKNIDDIVQSLQKVLRDNMLEEYIQANGDLIRCFTGIGFTYRIKVNIKRNIVETFYKMFISMTDDKKQIILDNIYTKLSNIEVEKKDDELPF